LYVLLIKGTNNLFQLSNLKDELALTGDKSISTGYELYKTLLNGGGIGSSEASGAYQTILLVVTSLALIWALRLTYKKKVSLRVRDGFYKGMTQLVPFIGVSLVIALQLIPALITTSLYALVQANSITIGAFQASGAVVLGLSGLALSFYMLSSSIMALYIVTLDDTEPMASLKAARKLVSFKRLIVFRKILFLPFALFLFSALVLIPIIIFVPVVAEVLFILFTILSLGVIHSYLYNLYRSLL
jgi:hypothetical protein